MLKKWVDSLGLPKWQPTVSDRICSDHFESYDVLMKNNIYGLNNDAIPSIKPQVCIQLYGNNNCIGNLIITDFFLCFIEFICYKL